MSSQQEADPDGADLDLYGDLDVAPAAAAKPTKTSVTMKKSLHHPKSFVEQVEELEARVKQLEGENYNLKRNIGTLFRTAKAEIQRKDAQISRLMVRQTQPTTK